MAQEEEILEALVSLANELSEFLGTDPAKHGMFRGTFQMALVEAQGGGIAKAGGGIGSSSLQATSQLASRMGSTIITRTQVTGNFDHYNSMRGAANGIASRLSSMQAKLAELTRLSPDAARVARQGYQPLMNVSGERLKLAQDVEGAIVEINNSGSANRLSSVLITETGRDAEALAEAQLQRRGVSMLPNAIGQGRALMQRIAQLPLNSEQAKEMIKDVATKGAAGMTAAYNMVRAAGTAGRAAARTAFQITGEFLAAFGARLVTIMLVPTKQLKSYSSGYDPDDGA